MIQVGKPKQKAKQRTDTVSPEVRSRVMASIRSRGTKMELSFANELRRRRIAFKQHVPWLGRPDFVFRSSGIVVFLDSCFWHRCPYHFRMPTSRPEYWKRKIRQNVERDKQVRADYKKAGWTVLRFWEHSVSTDEQACIGKIEALLRVSSPKQSLAPPTFRKILRGCVRFNPD